MLYSFCLYEALDLLQINVSTESNLDPITTVEAHSTDEECTAEWVRLWETWRVHLLLIMFSYWSSYIDIKDAITWSAIQVKHYYDLNWQPWFFAVRDEVLLQLHCRYKLSEITNQKLEQQFIEFFKVTEWIDCFVYCLDLPSVWKIHDIISIAHLELTSSNNLYKWAWSINLSAVTVDSAETEDHYEIKRLLQKWVSY